MPEAFGVPKASSHRTPSQLAVSISTANTLPVLVPTTSLPSPTAGPAEIASSRSPRQAVHKSQHCCDTPAHVIDGK